jgi:hypothetical protein
MPDPDPDTRNPRRDDPATPGRPKGPEAGELPPDVEPKQPPPRTTQRPPNANPQPGRDSRRNRAL